MQSWTFKTLNLWGQYSHMIKYSNISSVCLLAVVSMIVFQYSMLYIQKKIQSNIEM